MDVDENFNIQVLATVQQIQKTDLLNDMLSITMLTKSGEYVCAVEVENCEDPAPEMVIKAKLQLTRKSLFDHIQTLQLLKREERKAIFEQIKQLDKQIDQDQNLVIQVKDRDVRRELMDDILGFKKQIAGLYQIMKNDVYDHIDNTLLARLNDVAYRAIRKTGHQKKLDERAVKNEEVYKKLDAQLEAAAAKLNFDKLEAKYADICEAIGNCPISQQNVVECLQAKDCMCVGLEISRSEATINDPSKLIIREVHPSFMSLDSFLESSIYKLKCAQDASGGFDYEN